ncbi:methyltransferase domain-containing protein [Aeromicrobium sp. IC_218]|uniref:class I SAM-dependent methyltransferase n=1 Tax=Aeromicrobium sp. IC_218 TaxID=2545468 RepID=UPI0010406572|nr:methyltransferase domain-containing protein [Aeromicrobium sp. IC_218]TCI98874.1 methyltransferase domain-containing protein [Aeromicrobium sp. IC_218]
MSSTTPDRELKDRHRALWALGDYPAIADQVIPELGRVVVEAARVGPGEKVLDVAAGSGNASLPAAQAGADVVASDLTPALLDVGRSRAEELGLALDWREADAEELPFDDAAFDVALSCVGIMFAPHHQDAADELVRVVRPGGRIALVSWTPTGFIGQMLTTMRPFVPPPPPGTQPPPLWGDEEHVRTLLGDRVEDVRAERRLLRVERFAGGQEFLDYFKTAYGPTIAAYRAVADNPMREAELDQSLVRLAEQYAPEPGVLEWEYLLLTATRR